MLRNCKVRRYIALEVRIYADEKRAFLKAAWHLPSRQNRQKKQSEGVRFCLFGTQNTVPCCQNYTSYRLLFRRFCPLGKGSINLLPTNHCFIEN